MLVTELKRHPFLFSVLKGSYLFLAKMGSWYKWVRLSHEETIRLNLGSGARKGVDHWTTVDLYGADLNYDLKKGIPLKDNTVDAIYSSHLFEHFSYKSLLRLIGECKRVLKKNGTLSVCVPNAGNYIRAYTQKTKFRNDRPYQPYATVDTGSHLDQLNYIAYFGDQHHYLFDEENLVNTLKKGGFKKVGLREFDPSIDLMERQFESIYALAVKE